MTANPFAKSVNPTPVQQARDSKRLQAEYGNTLVCVHYRLDGHKRHTTVELFVNEQELPPPATRPQDIVSVAIGYQECELRAQAKQSGAVWDDDRHVWLMPR